MNSNNNLVTNLSNPKNISNTNIEKREKVKEIKMGTFHSSALTNWGNVYTWGKNNDGQLGDGSIKNLKQPTKITDKFGLIGEEKITQLSMGKMDFSSALTNKGSVYTWGNNKLGQLGDGTTENKNTPINITDKFGLSEGEYVTQLSMGGFHSSALTNKGNVYTWGRNEYGELGDGSSKNKKTPIKITEKFSLSGDEQITQLSMGRFHSSALTSKGNIYVWGYNNVGQLGDDSTTNLTTPKNIINEFILSENEQISQLNLGPSNSSALTNEGNVYTWGYNNVGQLGDGSKNDKQIPTKITGKFNLFGDEQITQLSMGTYHSSALTNKGTVYTWGKNEYGQLGDGSKENKSIPVKLVDKFDPDEQIKQLSMGSIHSSALTEKGTVYTWGNNDYSQLGLSNLNPRPLPSPLPIIDFSEVRYNGKKNLTYNSVTINFSVTKNDQQGNVVITDDKGKIKGKEDNVDGDGSITIDNLPSETEFSGWNIEVDSNGKRKIPSFKTLTHKSELKLSSTPIETTYNSVTINFSVTKNDQQGNVVITDDKGKIKGKEYNVDGDGSITIDNLPSETEFSGWNIEVDSNGKRKIPSFKTLTHKSELKLSSTPIETTYNSVTINFSVTKNDQQGNVIITDDKGKIKGKEDNVDGDGSITIDNLPSETEFSGWNIEVDSNGKRKIPSFKTLTHKSELKLSSTPIETTYNSVTINFSVTKNDQQGNVIITDDKGKIKGKEYNVDGDGSITIDNLPSETEFSGWNIEVDSNGKRKIPSFKTLTHKSELKLSSTPIETTYNSVTINFSVTKNDQQGNVIITDDKGKIKGKEDNVDGDGSITIDNLPSETEFSGWNIEVDSNGKRKIPSFKTLTHKSELKLSSIPTETTSNSVTINFTVDKNDQQGNVVIKDNKGKVKGEEDNVDGSSSILIKNLKPGTTFSGWTIEVDGNHPVEIYEFKTQPNTSNDIEEHLKINIKGEVKDSNKEITLIYSIEEWLKGEVRHIITYKNEKTQEVSLADSHFFNTNGVEKTYVLNQQVKNIEKIQTIYKIEDKDVFLDSYTGTAEKVLGVRKEKSGLSTGLIIGIVFGSITGVILIAVTIYFLTKKNKLKI